MKFLLSMLLLVCGVGGLGAHAQFEVGRHTLVGYLYMGKSGSTRLMFNPVHRGRFTIDVPNRKSVTKWIPRKEYSGLVRVDLEVSEEDDQVKVLKVSPVRARRWQVQANRG